MLIVYLVGFTRKGGEDVEEGNYITFLGIDTFFASESWVQPTTIEVVTEEGVPPLNDKEPKPKSRG